MKNEEERAVLTCNREFYAAFRAGSLTKMAALWSTTHVVACAHPGRGFYYGRAQVMRSWELILSDGNVPPVEHEGDQVLALGEVAVVTCTERVLDTELAATNVFVREAAGWRMVHHHAGIVAANIPVAPGREGLN